MRAEAASLEASGVAVSAARGSRPPLDAVRIAGVGCSVPPVEVASSEFYERIAPRCSDSLMSMLSALGVERRYSVVNDPAGYMLGEHPLKLASTATQIAADAVHRCLNSLPSAFDCSRIELMIAATSSPDRVFPGLGPQLVDELRGLIDPEIRLLGMQQQGCSVLVKAAETAGWYLNGRPDAAALVVVSEAQSAYIQQLRDTQHLGFKEILALAPSEQLAAARDTQLAVRQALFGDGAVALLLTADGARGALGAFHHATNLEHGDTELIFSPFHDQRAEHCDRDGLNLTLAAALPERGAAYARRVMDALVADPASTLERPSDLRSLLLHTGSHKILREICDEIGVGGADGPARVSFDVLAEYGNLSAASVGFMLDRPLPPGDGAIVAFGAGFSASAAQLSVPA
jgi:3-oxoacyl-[acyl-carrier-protein] synthase III